MNNNGCTHLAIIMDGNGRWAKAKGLARTAGHEEGAKVVRAITTHCNNIGIQYLTLYAFSTENWNRPKIEVNFLMKLLQRYLENELATYLTNNVRFRAIGDFSAFSKSLQKTIESISHQTAHCTGLTQILALNYGSQNEIVRAVNKMIANGLTTIDDVTLEGYLDTSFAPPVDLLIRTSGEVRVSNFLLWQIAYAEMFFTQTLWPEFSSTELDLILENFNLRQRRFGGL